MILSPKIINTLCLTLLIVGVISIMFVCGDETNEFEIKPNSNEALNVELNRVKRSTDNNTLPTNTTELRKVGKLGFYGYYGFYHNNIFTRCNPPSMLINDPETNNQTYLIPQSINYDTRCQYYDEKLLRKVGALGLNGTYGYYKNGKFKECEPPKGIDLQPNSNNTYFIPPDINYDYRCVYIGENPGDTYDYKGSMLTDSSYHTRINVFVFVLVCVQCFLLVIY